MAFYLSLLQQQFKQIKVGATLTSLWSGCGSIVACELDGQACVIKAVNIPEVINHPKIKQTAFAVNRKRKSYNVEYYFYNDCSQQLPNNAAAIGCLAAIQNDQRYVLAFNDFTQQGYVQALPQDYREVIKWLAHFHAFNLTIEAVTHAAEKLWPQGNYWHLSTRPDELTKLQQSAIKQVAAKLNTTLCNSAYKTVIHGDAKLANFAINKQQHVLGYDFQYVGAGVGVIDVMYFMTSCFNETQLHQHADSCLEWYFSELKLALGVYHPKVEASKVINDWRNLWSVAWADFYRFLAGWSPEHKKINSYMLLHVKSELKKHI
ncbi:phosphotransferase [Pseudoalteromonas sp. MIP2626]|uniref:phosphotransferase n=1 Tax=Pseudoalteromonas sp. MIP2626 TaxID=2705464 RepID=UPI0015C777AE|nr:phosphotransferase [Pseudoalteromonas sp. MIP2626]NYR11920.1 phosphotransferase [Pseudoalteromonas sp. MIP2626]